MNRCLSGGRELDREKKRSQRNAISIRFAEKKASAAIFFEFRAFYRTRAAKDIESFIDKR